MVVSRAWVGGSLGAGTGRWNTASDWSDGIVPQPGDLETILGVPNSGIQQIGQVVTFPIGAGYTSVFLFPQPPLGQAQTNPAGLVGDAVSGQILNLNGQQGALQLWLQHTVLAGDVVDVTGTVVMSTYLNDSIQGQINVGSGQGPGLLNVVLSDADTAGIGIDGQVANVALSTQTTIGPGSTLRVEALNSRGGIVEALSLLGPVLVGAGGTLTIDDTDGNGVQAAADNNLAVINASLIQLQGAPGQTTTGSITASLGGPAAQPGVIVVSGNGAPQSATRLTLSGDVVNQVIVVDDGTVALDDPMLTIGDPSQRGFVFAGGSFTFGPHGGTLLLHEPPLTTLGFTNGDTALEQQSDGQNPILTPIFGFGAGDTIGFVGATGNSAYYAAWDQATQGLFIASPPSIAGRPPEIIGHLVLAGSYNPSGFHAQANAQTGVLSVTYTG